MEGLTFMQNWQWVLLLILMQGVQRLQQSFEMTHGARVVINWLMNDE